VEYLAPLFSIIVINIILSGDNALVIALASRKLVPAQQKAAMLWGSAGAIGLRICLTFIAVLLLNIPYLQVVGGVLLLWIGIKLIAEQNNQEEVAARSNLWGAIKTIIIADVVMSLDNVIAIIGVAKGKVSLLIVGLIVSIPIIIWGSKLIGKFIHRWPIIIVIGSVFLGWTGGEMITDDRQMLKWNELYPWLTWGIPSVFAVLTLVIGSLLRSKNGKKSKNISFAPRKT
jgi:YjbE family integral membrane protein